MRWEDYTQTAMDPADDCTIWYVGDYLKKGAAAYSTKIGAFRLPGCLPQDAVPPASSPRPPAVQAEPTPADILRGAYGRYRSNNDLLSYDLDVRVDPVKKFISGTNRVRFRMLQDDSRIQLDLAAALNVDGITLGGRDLKYAREFNAVFVDFPERLRKGRVYEIAFRYSGSPAQSGRFGGIAFRTDPAGRPWINTACQHIGASVWWPNKDQYRDEVEEMRLGVAIPSDLVDVSNGKFLGKTDLGDGYTRWDWHIQYPINNYSVSLNIGHYAHFTDEVDGQTLDFYCLPENLEKAQAQFVQAKSMMQAFQKYIGPYPFRKDGYKLIEVPYSGMEHQSAVTYGNRFANGYLERDWTGVGISTKFDFIIVHESAHEWFGNAVTASDVCDEWIHEAWGTYAEGIYVEYVFGKADALTYLNGYKSKVRNRDPVVSRCGVNRVPPQDMYFKGALFINTLRSVVDDDERWWRTGARVLRPFQVPDHRDGRRRGVLQQQDGPDPGADLRPVPEARGDSRARAAIRRSRRDGVLPVEGGRAGVRDAGQGWREEQLADNPADRRVADALHGPDERPVRGRHRPLLHRRGQGDAPFLTSAHVSGVLGGVDDLAGRDGRLDAQVGRQQHQVGGEAGRDPSALAVQAEQLRGRGRHRLERLGQRAARDLDQVAQRLVQRQDAAGQRAVGQAGAGRVDDDFVVAQQVRAGGMPSAAIASVTRLIRFGPSICHTSSMIDGWVWTPSAMNPTVIRSSVSSAPGRPGSRCPSDGMALKRCVP